MTYLYIEKAPITIVSGTPPFIVANLLAHKVIDNDTSRIVKLSTIGGELNTIQHYGHNSRILHITGRINLVNGGGFFSRGSITAESILTGLRIFKETKSAVLVIMNHGILYGVIESFKIIDDRDYPTSFDYELIIVEKDLFGLKFSAIAQRLFSGILATISTSVGERERFTSGDTIIPDFSELTSG